MKTSKTIRCTAVLLGALLGTACGGDATTGDGGGGSIEVQISGEDLAVDGLRFPTGSEVTIADGWEITFDHVFVTVGRVFLADNPDESPSDQSQTGAEVAEASGPWAIDLHTAGTLTGAGGEGTATPLLTIDRQNLNGDRPFEFDRRYAFGFDVVAASTKATHVNFEKDPEAESAYEEMISKGYTVMYIGTASFRGETCQTSDPVYDFTAIPKTVRFRLGFTTPVTALNCQNQANQGAPFDGENYQRGVAIPTNAPATAQITLHIDHPFYSDVQHEPRLYFDQMAGRLLGKGPDAVLTMDDLVGVDPTAFKDAAGFALPFRTCDGSPPPAAKQRSFETGSVPVDPAGDPAKALRDYRDFVHYVQSTQGHLGGGEGLCYTKRNYPSPQ